MPDSVVGINLGDDHNDKIKDSATVERDQRKDVASEDQKQADRSDTHEEARPVSESGPSSSDFLKEQAPKDTEESVVSASHTELQSNTVKGSEDGSSNGVNSHSKEPLKDEDAIPISKNQGADALFTSNSRTEKDNLASTILFLACFHHCKNVYGE